MIRRGFALFSFAVLLVFGTTFVQAQEEDGTDCYPRVRDNIRRTVVPVVPSDEEEWSFPMIPLIPVAPPQPEVNTPAPVPPAPDWSAEFYRFPLIPAEPGPERDALIARFGTGTVIDQTVDADESLPDVDLSVPIRVRPATVVRSLPNDGGELVETLFDDLDVEAIGRDPTGRFIGVRLPDGRLGWIRVSDIQEGMERTLDLQIADPSGIHYNPFPPVSSCNLPNGLVIQSPENTPVFLVLNTMPMEVTGTIVVTISDIDGDGANDTMFVTVANGQVMTLLPDNPFTMSSVAETVGLELNPQGDIVGYTGVVPEEPQQREILLNAEFSCQMYKNFLYIQPSDCNIGDLPPNLREFVSSVTETVVAEATETVPVAEQTEVVALPEATAVPEGGEVLTEFIDPTQDIVNCNSLQPLATVSEAAQKADIATVRIQNAFFSRVAPTDFGLYNGQYDVVVILNDALVADIAARRENFAIILTTLMRDGSEVRYIYESHSGQISAQGQLLGPGQVTPDTVTVVGLIGNTVVFNLLDDVVQITLQSYVEDANRVLAGCDRVEDVM